MDNSKDTGLLNLSASVSPDDFAQRFGHLLNTWVSLGYCPQCTSDMLAGNDTAIPASLQPYYRQATATATYPGDQVLTINWAWLVTLLASATILLIAGVTSVVVESAVVNKSYFGRNAGDDEAREDVLIPQISKDDSTAHGGLRSTQWA